MEQDRTPGVRAVRPDRALVTRQRLPHFVGISGETVGAHGLSMHLIAIPPGGRSEPHAHRLYETAIYVLEGRVETRYGPDLAASVISEAGDFLFIPPDEPHLAITSARASPRAPSWPATTRPSRRTWCLTSCSGARPAPRKD